MARGGPGVRKFAWSTDAVDLLEKIVASSRTVEDVSERFSRETGFAMTVAAVRNAFSRLTGSTIASRLLPPEGPAPSPAIEIQEGEWGDDEPTRSHPSSPPAPAQTQPVLPDDARASSPTPDEQMFERLFRLCGRVPMSLEAVCDSLDMPPTKVRDLIARAKDSGFRVELTEGEVGVRPNDSPLEVQQVEVDQPGEVRRIALVGDIHFGSKHHLGAQLRDFCEKAHAAGVRQFLHVGDLLDGVYSHSIWEQSERGFEEQVGAAVLGLPQMQGSTWHWIQGNHDETLGERNGMEVGVRATQAFLAAGRQDVVYHGARGAYLELKHSSERRGLHVELWHPRDKANAYALSYRQQKHIEKYAPGAKPDLLATGHWHQSFYFETRGVHAFSCGCFQGGQSSFGKSIGGSPSIGSWIVEYSMTAGGTVRRVKGEWVRYYERETVREVGLG